MYEVIILTISPELERNEFDTLLPLVSPEKQERIKKFRLFQDARNCLLGDILSRVEICRATGFNNRQLKFTVNNFGKPLLISCPDIHYNISHSRDYIACVIADKPVGIDVEVIKPINLKIAERFFSPDETSYIMAGEKALRFYEVWTKKESHVKWEGKGLNKPLASFSVIDKGKHDRPIYHKIFHTSEAICHTCSLINTPPSVRFIDTVHLQAYAMGLDPY